VSRRQPGSPVMSDADRRFAVITPAVARALPREQTSQVGGEGETLNACIDRVENRQVQTLLDRTAENRGVSPPNAPCVGAGCARATRLARPRRTAAGIELSAAHRAGAARSIAALIGSEGIGPWQDEEIQAAMQLAVRTQRPLIPVLLPRAPKEIPELPLFIGNRTWVDLRSGLSEAGINDLVSATRASASRRSYIPGRCAHERTGGWSPSPAAKVPKRSRAARWCAR